MRASRPSRKSSKSIDAFSCFFLHTFFIEGAKSMQKQCSIPKMLLVLLEIVFWCVWEAGGGQSSQSEQGGDKEVPRKSGHACQPCTRCLESSKHLQPCPTRVACVGSVRFARGYPLLCISAGLSVRLSEVFPMLAVFFQQSSVVRLLCVVLNVIISGFCLEQKG